MSIFANTTEHQGTRIAPSPEVDGDDGFAAFGKPVPFHRRDNGYQACKSMGMKDPEAIWTLIGQMSDKIERDEPLAAMEIAKAKLDVTGCYRLLATLCTG